MTFLRLIKLVAAALYRALYLAHHKIFLAKGLPLKYSQLIIVGGFNVGGVGKTPFCIWLSKLISSKQKRVAVLCHKYAYDEIKMYRKIFAQNSLVQIFETSNRYKLAHKLDSQKKFDVILCDDGFEDSRLAGAVYFVLLWDLPPKKICELWPSGCARSLQKDHICNNNYKQLKCYGNNPDVSFYISHICNIFGKNLDTKNYRQINVICAIGSPERFFADIKSFGIAVDKIFNLKDHSKNFCKLLKEKLQHNPQTAFIITEKDFAKIDSSIKNISRVYIAYQKVNVNAKLLYF